MQVIFRQQPKVSSRQHCGSRLVFARDGRLFVVLGDRFSIEAVIGGGYARMEYDKYRCAGCGERMGHYKRNYFGPTRAGVSLIYFIR